jgi:AhpC/TSA family
MQQTKAPPSVAQAELEKLQNDMRQRQQALFKDFEKVPEKDQEKAYGAISTKLFTEFWPRYQKLIKTSKGGVQVRARLAALSLAQMSPKPGLGDRLVADMIRENRDLPEVAQLAMTLRYESYDPKKQAKLKAQLEALSKSKDTGVQAAVLYAQAEMTKDREAKASVPLYRELLAKYPTTPYAKRAKGAIFEAENLQVGMVAPEITGPDQEGNTFKLSEYRGKVVVLDFWGFW